MTDEFKIINKSIKRIAVFIILMLVVGWNFSEQLINYMISLSSFRLLTISPFEMIHSRFNVSLVFAIAASIPLMYIEIYKFVIPSLYKKEKKIFKLSTIPFFIMFLFGASFALYIFLPIVMIYINEFYIDGIDNSVTLNNYISFLLSTIFMFGIVFCYPVILAILSYVNIINYKSMKIYRKHVILFIFVLGAIVTPPEVFTQLMVSIPLIALYELSICISWILNKIQKDDRGN